MKIPRILTLFLLFAAVSNLQAQENYGGEIVSYETFGEGMMVTRAKIVPLSGTVTNMFFFNRADEPWNKGSAWNKGSGQFFNVPSLYIEKLT